MKVPSANKRLKVFGSLKATKKASAKIEAPRNNKSSKFGKFLFEPPPLMSYIPVSAALLISEFVYASKVCEVLGSVIDFFFT